MAVKILVCIVAGLGAGFGTGLAGLSAAAVISPMLIAFLGVDPYEAVGIALASDVLASAASAVTYKKNNNIDVKNGIYMLISVLVFTLIGSYIGSLIPKTTLGSFSMFTTLLVGIKFIVKPVMAAKESNLTRTKSAVVVQSVLSGIVVGLICGIVGAGGGMMMLIVLVMVLGYDLKTAVGTSVLIMTFTALTGALSHFVIGGGITDISILIICVLATLFGAWITAKFANKASNEVMNRTLGVGLSVLGILMLVMDKLA